MRVDVTMPRKAFDFHDMERRLVTEFNKKLCAGNNRIVKVHLFRNFTEGGYMVHDGRVLEV